MYTPHPMEFLQLPNRIVIIYEIGTLWRNVWMDGRQHPKDPNPTFLGDSIGLVFTPFYEKGLKPAAYFGLLAVIMTVTAVAFIPISRKFEREPAEAGQ